MATPHAGSQVRGLSLRSRSASAKLQGLAVRNSKRLIELFERSTVIGRLASRRKWTLTEVTPLSLSWILVFSCGRLANDPAGRVFILLCARLIFLTLVNPAQRYRGISVRDMFSSRTLSSLPATPENSSELSSTGFPPMSRYWRCLRPEKTPFSILLMLHVWIVSVRSFLLSLTTVLFSVPPMSQRPSFRTYNVQMNNEWITSSTTW